MLRQKTHLGGRHLQEVKLIYAAILRIEHEEYRKIGVRNVNAFTKRVWKMTFSTKLTARVPDGAPRQVKEAVREGVRLLLLNADRGINKSVAMRLGEQLRLTNTRPKTIAGTLARWRQECKNFDPDQAPDCT